MSNTLSLENLDDLSPEQRAILMQWLRREASASGERRGKSAPIARSERREEWPLSFAQQRLWFLEQLGPGSSNYNVPLAVVARGPLDLAVLQQTLDHLLGRHEVLRASFHNLDGRPVQRVAPALALPLAVESLEDLPAGERLAAAREIAAREAGRAFDLGRAPLLRVRVLRLAGDEHVVVLVMHHIISDGWSLGVLVKELGALYAAFARGEASPLEELPIQYADYAVWQREVLGGEEMGRQLAYWRERLSGAEMLELPAERARPAAQSFRGAQHHFTLPRELSEALGVLARREDATLFMVLLAGFQTLLHRYTQQADIVVGTPVAGRNRAEVENLIGFFVNTLVLRTDLSGDPSFRELLRRVREVTLGAFEHQDVPFERLVEELRPERDPSHQPLFQVMLVLQNTPQEAVGLGDLRLGRLALESNLAKFDLTLGLEEGVDGLRGAFEYNTDLFEAATVANLARHFERLLQAATANPEQALSRLPMLGDEERRRLLSEWNDTARDRQPARCVHELVEAQAARRPEALAVACGGTRLTYGELNRRANRLAHYLRGRGVGPEARVGVLLGRSAELVVALLAVLKAGAAYLPLDPQYPEDRLSYMLEDAGVGLVLTERSLSARLGGQTGPEAVCLDGDGPAAGACAENPAGGATAENLAYVIYTSGSTGRPKGVQIEHRGLLNLIGWHRRAYRVTPEDRATQLAGLAFDASVWEVWPYLAAGASLHLPDEETRSTPALLQQWLAAQGITITFLPTPLAERLLPLEWPPRMALRALLTGGDQLHQYAPDGAPFELVNNYGPTENTVVATAGRVGGGGPGGRAPSIGRPVDNTRVYILDAHLQPVPVAARGELYIGGESLARGYLNRPGLTAERFIPDPFGTTPGARLYRTGDVARYSWGGEIEFLGRADHQVKVRGFRIELGEIEAVLCLHASVREAVVVPSEGAGGDKRLVAYVVAAGEPAATPAELRDFLRLKLPDYMIPTAYVTLGQMPLTPNGKVNRRALPAPEPSALEPGRDYAAPHTATEEMLAGLWAELLGVERVGRHDDFFDLGGHSLLATQFVTRASQIFQTEVALRTLFESPTIAELSEKIEALVRSRRGVQFPPLVPSERREEWPLSFAQQRLWFLEQLGPGSSNYNVPLAVLLRGPLDVPRLRRTLDHLLGRHEVLRASFHNLDGRPVQRVAPALALPLAVESLEDLPAGERLAAAREIAAREAGRAFDLGRAPLLRVRVLRLAGDEHVVVLVMHHIISDGWSLGILMREVGALYEAFGRDEEAALADLTVQYADYAVWQREVLGGEEMGRQLAYWRGQLKGAEALELPAERARPAAQSFRGARQTFALSPHLTEELKALSRREGVTLFMTLLAAFQTLLHRHTGQEDIVVGTSIANRTSLETEQLLGCFFNQLALRTDLSGAPTFRQLLGRVREVTLAAYAHQDVPFEKVVESLHPERGPNSFPLFQVFFVLQNAPAEPPRMSGLTLSTLELPTSATKFDLALMMEEGAGGLRGVLDYSTDLFDASSVRRLLGRFRALLEDVARHPDEELPRLSMGAGEEARQSIDDFNDDLKE